MVVSSYVVIVISVGILLLSSNGVIRVILLFLQFVYFYSLYFELPTGMLQSARNVIGVELCSDAVEDAKTNARINGKWFVIDNLR